MIPARWQVRPATAGPFIRSAVQISFTRPASNRPYACGGCPPRRGVPSPPPHPPWIAPSAPPARDRLRPLPPRGGVPVGCRHRLPPWNRRKRGLTATLAGPPGGQEEAAAASPARVVLPASGGSAGASSMPPVRCAATSCAVTVSSPANPDRSPAGTASSAASASPGRDPPPRGRTTPPHQQARNPDLSRASTDSEEPRTVTTWCLRHRSDGPPGIHVKDSGGAVAYADMATVTPSTKHRSSHSATHTAATPSVTGTLLQLDVLRDGRHWAGLRVEPVGAEAGAGEEAELCPFAELSEHVAGLDLQ